MVVSSPQAYTNFCLLSGEYVELNTTITISQNDFPSNFTRSRRFVVLGSIYSVGGTLSDLNVTLKVTTYDDKIFTATIFSVSNVEFSYVNFNTEECYYLDAAYSLEEFFDVTYINFPITNVAPYRDKKIELTFDSSQYSAAFLSVNLFLNTTANAFPDESNYNDGYKAGYQVGKNEGLSEGNSIGYNNGYNIGFEAGKISSGDVNSVFTILKGAFKPVADILNFHITPHLTLGTIICVPIVIGVLYALWRVLAA